MTTMNDDATFCETNPTPPKNQLLSFRVSKCHPSLECLSRVLMQEEISRHRQSSRATRRKKTADDLNDGETCVIRVRFFFPSFRSRAFRELSLSLSLRLCVRVAFFGARFFLRPFVLRALGVGLYTRREKTRKIRASRRRVWTRIDGIARKKMRRAWFSSGAARGGGSDDARPRPRSRDLDFWFWVGHLFEIPFVGRLFACARVLRLCELTFLFLSFCRSRALLSRDQEQTVPEI